MPKHLFLLLTLLAVPGRAFAGDLSADEIKAQLVGQAILWWDEGGWTMGNLYFVPDGRAHITVELPHQERDAGQWSIQGNEICTEWSFMRSAKPKCYSIRQEKPGHFVTSGGNKFEILNIGV